MNKNFKLTAFIFILYLTLFLSELNAYPESLFPSVEPTISMDFQDANLKDILKILSIQSGLNFIASEALQDRKITLYLDKVPLEKAMDKLFAANNLTYELDKEANIFMVKDWGRPQIETTTRVFFLKHATVSSSSLKEEMSKQISSGATAGGATAGGATAGGTGEGKWAVEGDTGITKAAKKILSEFGSVVEDFRTNSLIVTDIPSRIAVIAGVITALDVPVSQVMLEVEILDVSKDTVDKMGFDWENAGSFGMKVLTASRGTGFPLSGYNPSDNRVHSAVSSGQISFLPATGLSIILDYLNTQTDTKYLARPRILTVNNETAEIAITKDEIVGYNEKVEIPAQGPAITTREYIRSTDLKLTGEGTGVFLRVTPQINSDTGEITLVVNPKSSITNANTIFTLQSDAEVRSTRSIIKLRDGETVILGGLIHNDKKVITRKLPILGDIPLIGMLFSHKNQTKDIERELLVFITPRIVKDTNIELAQAKKVVLPQREQNTTLGDRQAIINTSLNSFEKKKR